MGDFLSLLQVMIGAATLFISILDFRRGAPSAEADGSSNQSEE